jgi:hypothetical protein
MVTQWWTYNQNTVEPWWFYHDNIAYRLTTKWLRKKFDLLEFQQGFFLKRPLCNLFICFFGQWGETYKIIFFSIRCIASWSQSFCSLRASKEITILVQIQYVCTHNFTLLWCCIQHIPPTLSWWMRQESPCYRQMVPCYHKRFIMFQNVIIKQSFIMALSRAHHRFMGVSPYHHHRIVLVSIMFLPCRHRSDPC